MVKKFSSHLWVLIIILSLISCKERAVEVVPEENNFPNEATTAGWEIVLTNSQILCFAFDSELNLYFADYQHLIVADRRFNIIDTLSLPPKYNNYSISKIFINDYNIIFLGLYSGMNHHLLVSEDKGKTWSAPPTYRQTEITGIFSKENRIYITSSSHDESRGMVQISEDNGQTWRAIIQERHLHYYFCRENDAKRIFFGKEESYPGNKYFSYSDDYGVTFTENVIPFSLTFANSLAFGNNNNLLIANGCGIFITPDYGLTWKAIYEKLSYKEYFDIFNSANNRIYVMHGWSGQFPEWGLFGVYVSYDGGYKWYKYLRSPEGYFYINNYRLCSDGYLYIITTIKDKNCICRSSIPLFN